MSVIGDLVSAANPITAVVNAANTLIDRLVPDANAAQKAKDELAAAAQQATIQAAADQREINKTEAASASLFVAGWRPAVGWLCVVTLAYDWIGVPTIMWWTALFHFAVPPLPHLDSSETQALLYALLGIGGLRTMDKLKGKDTKGVLFRRQ